MLNPFKKKEESYKLDQMSLPSMSSQQSNQSPTDQNNFGQQISPPSFDNHPASVDNYENAQMANDQPLNQHQFPTQNSDFNSTTATPQAFDNSSSSQINSFSSQATPNLGGTPSNQNAYSNDLSAVQLETLDKKVSLLDTRINIIEDKINKIYEMLTLEVSEDTRSKVNIKIDKSKFSN